MDDGGHEWTMFSHSVHLGLEARNEPMSFRCAYLHPSSPHPPTFVPCVGRGGSTTPMLCSTSIIILPYKTYTGSFSSGSTTAS
jgi:hypothetical protein